MKTTQSQMVDDKSAEQTLDVLEVYYEPTPAGQTRHVAALVQALARHGHRITVVLPDRLVSAQTPAGRQAIWAEKQTGIRLVPLRMQKSLWPLQSVWALARLVRQTKPQIVHVHSLEAGLCGRATSWLASVAYHGGPRLIYTPQTIDIRRAQWHGLYRGLERLLAAITDVTISVNEADRGRLLRWGLSPCQVVTIPNGIEIEALDDARASEMRRSLGLDPDRPLVMQVARLSTQKNPLAFVEGAALIAQQHPKAQFAMLGQGPLQEAVAARIQHLGMQKHVHLLGWREQARRLMAAADVITLTSRWEGLPYSLLEAMAAAKPIVTTSVNGCPEAVEHGRTGYLVPPDDPAAWAKRVIELLEDPARAAKMGQAGRERAQERFALPKTVAQIEALYRDLACATQGMRERR